MNVNEKQVENWKYVHEHTLGYTKKSFIIGAIDSVAYTSDFTTTYRLKIAKIDNSSPTKVDTNIGIFIEVPKNLSLTIGNTLSFTGKILPLLSFPFDGFERYVWKSGVYGKVSVPQFTLLSKAKQGSPLQKIQTSSKEIVFKGFPRDVASIVLGMTLGSTDLLTRQVKDTFILSGMSHILVVSGSNIAFVIFFLLFFLKYLPLGKYSRILGIALFVLIYGSLVGWETPVIRAASMGIIAYIGIQYSSRISSITLLALVAIIILSYNPTLLLFDAGFGLSFCATLGILLYHETFSELCSRLSIPKFFIPFFSVTLGATLGSLPLVIFHFGVLSIGGILANIIIGFFCSWILFSSVIYMVFAYLGFPGLFWLGLIVYIPTKFVLSIALFFAAGLHLTVPESMRTSITLIILGYFVLEIFTKEYARLILKSQKGSRNQEKDLLE